MLHDEKAPVYIIMWFILKCIKIILINMLEIGVSRKHPFTQSCDVF